MYRIHHLALSWIQAAGRSWSGVIFKCQVDIIVTHSTVGPGWGATWEMDKTIPGSRPKGHISVRYVRFLLMLHLLIKGTRDNCPTPKSLNAFLTRNAHFYPSLKSQILPSPPHHYIIKLVGDVVQSCHLHPTDITCGHHWQNKWHSSLLPKRDAQSNNFKILSSPLWTQSNLQSSKSNLVTRHIIMICWRVFPFSPANSCCQGIPEFYCPVSSDKGYNSPSSHRRKRNNLPCTNF